MREFTGAETLNSFLGILVLRLQLQWEYARNLQLKEPKELLLQLECLQFWEEFM